MLRNYFIIALRNISRHKAYSFINIAGLVIGLAATFFIVLWIQDELSFNTFLKDRGDVYRVMRHATFGGTKGSSASMPKPIVQVLRDEYPEFTHVALMSWPMDMVLTQNDEVYRSKGRYFGADIFHILKYPLIAGDHPVADKFFSGCFRLPPVFEKHDRIGSLDRDLAKRFGW